MRKLTLAIAIILAVAPALAQDASTQTPNEQALLAEITAQQSAKLQCMSAAISLKAELDKAMLKIKGLEAKLPAEDKPK